MRTVFGDYIFSVQPGFASGERAEDGVIQLRMNNVDTRGRIDLTECLRVPFDAKQVARYGLQPDDILFNNTNSTELVGKTARFEGFAEPVVFSNHFTRLRVKPDRADSTFVSFFLNHLWNRKVFEVLCQRWIGQSAVKYDKLASIETNFPDLPTQRRIAARLKEQLAAGEQARQAAEDQRRFAAAIKDRLAFEILELGDRWPRRPLEELCEIESGQVDPKLPEYSCLPHVNGENIISGKSRLFNVRTAGEDGMTSGKYLFRRGHVLYSKLRPYLRKAVLAEFDGVCSADMYPIKPFPTLLDARFLCQLLLSAPFSTYAAEKSQRARMPKINREQLLSWKAPVPDLKTQRKLSTRLSEIEDETHKLETAVENQLTALQKLPAAFLREAFGGIS